MKPTKWSLFGFSAPFALALVAYFAFLLAWMSVLAEGVHSLGHTSHSFSLLARLFDDGTHIPLVFSVGSALTAGLGGAIALRSASGRPRFRFARSWTSFSLAVVGVASISLFALDIRHGPGSSLFATLTVVLVGHGLVAALCLLSPARYLRYLLPLLALIPTPAVLYFVSETWTVAAAEGTSLPSIMPTMAFSFTSLHLAGLLGATVFLMWRLSALAFSILALWSWTLLGVVAFVRANEFHHLCFLFRHTQMHAMAAVVVGFFFVGLWALFLWRKGASPPQTQAKSP